MLFIGKKIKKVVNLGFYFFDLSTQMITIKLQGGLGNQLFQYAFAKALAKRLNTVFQFDDSFYSKNIARKNNLFLFAINISIYSSKFQKWNWLRKRLSIVIGLKKYIVESRFSFNDILKQIDGDVYLDGYWQSDRYFQDIQSEIRQDFSIFKEPISEEASPILEQIKTTNSVCIHVRRGDYLTNRRYLVLGMDYYQKAIELLSNQFADLHFFVFSDDISWCKQHFKSSENVLLVSDSQIFTLRDDFEMMLSCKHHITANSTLSWWAAWLNDNPEKVVITPQKWFADSTNTKDLLPKNWTKL
jgi:hypothetical protein